MTTSPALEPHSPSLRERWLGAPTFRDFLDGAVEHRELWLASARRARVDESIVARAAAVPGRWHLLVLLEDWCGDAVNTVPYVAKLATLAPNVDVRILSRDTNPDLMDAHLSGPQGTSRAIPVVMVLDDEFEERGWWGSRPSALQRWVEREGLALPKEQRYLHVRTWYARDGGRTTLDEIVGLMERAAGVRAAA